jgi:uncharacterized membrane protein YdjX (TVP38/TMEM64 family)
MEKTIKRLLQNILVLLGILAVLAGLLLAFIWDDVSLTRAVFHLQTALENGNYLRESFRAYGFLAPIFFIVMQILQVILAPIPGEATGVLGGYIFGFWPGLIYSTLALTIGSGIAFSIGQIFSTGIKKKCKNSRIYQRFNHLVAKGDFVIPFVLFLLPGFPKDSLSYLLGLSFMPFKVFLFVAGVARIPGTIMLSLQGAKVYQAQYLELAFLLLLSAAVSLPCYLFRKKILSMLSAYNNRNLGE